MVKREDLRSSLRFCLDTQDMESSSECTLNEKETRIGRLRQSRRKGIYATECRSPGAISHRVHIDFRA